jgi:hypothetical protein
VVKITALDVITAHIYDISPRLLFVGEMNVFSVRCALTSKKFLNVYMCGKR